MSSFNLRMFIVFCYFMHGWGSGWVCDRVGNWLGRWVSWGATKWVGEWVAEWLSGCGPVCLIRVSGWMCVWVGDWLCLLRFTAVYQQSLNGAASLHHIMVCDSYMFACSQRTPRQGKLTTCVIHHVRTKNTFWRPWPRENIFWFICHGMSTNMPRHIFVDEMSTNL